MAKKNPYVPHQEDVFAISRSKIENFVQCPRCFVLDRRHKVAVPSGPSFTINSAVDSLLKKEFDRHRDAGTVHPVLKELGCDLVPLKNSNMDVWRENFKGVRYLHEPTNLEVFGAVDDLWVNAEGEIVVVDYKATAKATPVEELGAERWHDAYRRQIEVYQWLLRQLGYKVSSTGYWLYETARNNADEFNQKLDFDARLISYEGNTDWVEPILFDIKAALDDEGLPWSSNSCEVCKFFDSRAFATSTQGEEIYPHCFVCGEVKKEARYGMPAGPVDESRVVLMGCVIDMNQPSASWICTSCERHSDED
jgi:hypothetical protein